MKTQPPGLVNPKLLGNEKFRFHQASVFVITAALYTSLHIFRTAWAYSHKSIENDDYFTDHTLGVLNTAFMISYAIGLFYSGWLGDHSDLRGFLARGAFLSVCGFLTFAFLARFGFHNIIVYAILFTLSGYGQSRQFPGIMAILGNWIERSHRGVLIGIWNSCVNVGNIIGQQIGKFMIDIHGQHWSNVLFVSAGCIMFMVIIVLLFLKVTPREAGFVTNTREINIDVEVQTNELKHPESDGETNALPSSSTLPSVTLKGIDFLEAWKTPGIIKYGLIYACLKGATYGVLFWLPDYLQTVIGFGSESANITATYEFGQFFGAILLGYCSDRLGKRSIVIVVTLYLCALIFILLTTLDAGSSAWIFGILLFLAGFSLGGPEVMIGNIVSSDIGESKSLENNARALATTVGIIDGTGAIGAALVQLIIPYLKSHSFFLYFGLCMIAAIIITPIAIKELRALRKRAQDNKELIRMAAPKNEEM